jgi:site-specific DNA-methyltransferase (adenine-specific)
MVKLMLGDCLDRLKELDDNSVDSVVTDPPYGLSFMGKKWDYDVPSEDIWRECLRVLKPGGHLLAFAGTRTQHRMAVRIEDAGFEIRDMIAWIYGSGFPKSLNIGKAVDKLQGNEREVVGKRNLNQGISVRTPNTFNDDAWKGNSTITKGTSPHEGWGTALKPALEPITVARKPLSEKTVAENVLEWGTGGINVDGCRVGLVDGDDTKRATGGHKTSYIGGHIEKNYGIENQANRDLGRFPANLIHDGSEEVVGLFPESKSTGGTGEKSKGKLGVLGFEGRATGGFGDQGSAARFFYCAKASKKDRDEGMTTPEQAVVTFATANGTSGKPSSISEGRNTAYKNNHPTVKPTDLMRYLCRLVTPPGGIVLDPFMGSGSTGKAAVKEGFQFIGIEMSEEYMEIAKARIEYGHRGK